RRIKLDTEKFNTLDHHRAGVGTDTWRDDLGHQPGALYNDLASRTRSRPTISAAMIPRANVPIAGAPAPTAAARPAPPAPAVAGPSPTAMLRSPAPRLAPGGRGSQAGTNTQPGLADPRIIMPSGFPHLMPPRTAAPSTAWTPGSRAPVEGVSR